MQSIALSNGIWASQAAAFMAVLSFSAVGVICKQMWDKRREIWPDGGPVDVRRFNVYLALILTFAGLGGHRVSVVMFIMGMTDGADIWPTAIVAVAAFGLLWLFYLSTKKKFGHWGWLALFALATAAALGLG